MSYFSGKVHTVIFSNEAQDFYIVRMVLDDEGNEGMRSMFDDSKHAVVRGNVPGMTLTFGTWLGFEGKWVNHPEYGRQIQITRAPVIKEWNADVAVSMLTSNGVGGRVARRIAAELGPEMVPVLDEWDEARLAAIEGITSFQAAHVIATWREVKSFHRTLDFLAETGVSRSLIPRIWVAFGDDAEKVLTENPWKLVEIDGIQFEQADAVARKIGLDMTSPLRHQGAVLWVCKTARGMGHVYMNIGEVIQGMQAYIPDVTSADVAKALGVCHNSGSLVIDRKTRAGTTAIYEPWLYRIERDCAALLRARVVDAQIEEEVLDDYAHALASLGSEAAKAEEAGAGLREIAAAGLNDWERGSKIKLSADQKEGALNALTEPVSILTGLPGTGKTTALNHVVSVLQDAEVRLLLIAPTGIAAKRMKTLTGADAATIHRAFGARGFSDEKRESTYAGIVDNAERERSLGSDGSLETWLCTDTPHPADVVICDESSMVDQHLLYRILTCTKPTTRLVFVGDAAQLPSVGPGNVLRELIASELFPTVSLTEIFRQADTSDIVVAAHDINKGEVPDTSKPKSDFGLYQLTREEEVLEAIVKIASKLYEARREFQIISPKHAGTLGVTNLNAKLREILNPKQPGVHEMKVGQEVLREGDRIMVVKNDYERNIFNGDVGKVMQLDRKDRAVMVKIHGPPAMHVSIPFRLAGDLLRLAYAMTVHKAQGQEYDVIVMPLVQSFAHQLQRNLFYTAVTRAKKKVVIIGHRGALVRAVADNRIDERNTLFTDRLKVEFEAVS